MRWNRAALVMIITLFVSALASADDWPTYMHDNARSGVATNSVDMPLTEQWVYHAPAEPRPAWTDLKPSAILIGTTLSL